MKNRIYFFLQTYFGFSRRESRGFILVLPAIFLLYSIPLGYDWVVSKTQEDIYLSYEKKVDSLLTAGWTVIDNPKDLIQKPYPDSTKRSNTYKRPPSPQLNKLKFSEADSIVLQIVPGIGPSMAGRIVKFRENIGGIHQKDQLLDVFGMNPEVMERLFDYFDFDKVPIKKLHINSADANALSKHPYINYGAAKVIVAFRDQHGPYQKPEDLLKIKIFTEDWISRLVPYLEF